MAPSQVRFFARHLTHAFSARPRSVFRILSDDPCCPALSRFIAFAVNICPFRAGSDKCCRRRTIIRSKEASREYPKPSGNIVKAPIIPYADIRRLFQRSYRSCGECRKQRLALVIFELETSGPMCFSTSTPRRQISSVRSSHTSDCPLDQGLYWRKSGEETLVGVCFRGVRRGGICLGCPGLLVLKRCIWSSTHSHVLPRVYPCFINRRKTLLPIAIGGRKYLGSDPGPP